VAPICADPGYPGKGMELIARPDDSMASAGDEIGLEEIWQ
jgi:hypothetical protein